MRLRGGGVCFLVFQSLLRQKAAEKHAIKCKKNKKKLYENKHKLKTRWAAMSKKRTESHRWGWTPMAFPDAAAKCQEQVCCPAGAWKEKLSPAEPASFITFRNLLKDCFC